MTYIDSLIFGLEGSGYNAYTDPQEKEEVKQVIVQIDTADIEKETQASYRYTPSISMTIECDNASLDSTIKSIIAIAESSVTPDIIDFQITDIDINKLGTSNLLVIKATYVEMIYVTNI